MNSIIRATARLVMGPVRERMSLIKPTYKTGFLMNIRSVHHHALTYDFARERVMLVLRLYDKIDPNTLTLESNFRKDLGLDSLDHVDVIMAMEDEFDLEIPDQDMERLQRPIDIVTYVTDMIEAYEELQKLQAEHHHGHDHGHHKLPFHQHIPWPEEEVGPMPQKRKFSTYSVVAKRYSSSGSEFEYATSFGKRPPTEISFEDIQNRVMKVCTKYDKIDSSKLELASHFMTDLGLDSLDHIEIIMELEDEFGLEIPDHDAEKLLRPTEIAKYIFEKEEARQMPAEKPAI